MEGTKSNRDGFGTIVKIHIGDKIQKQTLSSGQGYFSNNAKELYFGLKQADKIDQIDIFWPSGIYQSFTGISTKQTVYIVEGKSLYNNTLVFKGGR